jgi:geranylgeranyl diphosphate synthase, type I
MTVTSVAGRARTVQHMLAEARMLVEPAHRAAVDRLPDLMRHIAGYHAGWWDARGQPTANHGKSVRPALVLATAAAVGGRPADAVAQAVTVELVHDFSLLHDDIIDGDLTRRHRPSAWSVFGVSEAILAGDMLMSLAADLLAGRPCVKVLTRAVLDLCTGQAADMAFGQRADVGVEECAAMAAGKTGALLACAGELGALAGGGDARQAALLAQFGHHLGMAFQLVDDLLGIWGDPALTGKPAQSDLASRKKSLPVVAALTSGTPAGDRLARLYHHDCNGGHTALTRIADLIEESGARSWAQTEADRHLGLALDCLTRAVPDESGTADLTALAHLIARRDH